MSNAKPTQPRRPGPRIATARWRRPPVVIAAAAVVVLAGAGTAVGLTVGGGDDPTPHPSASTTRGPRPLTAAEADRLAITRFDNYRGTGVRFRTSVSSAQGPLTLVGDVDYRRKLGYALVSGAGSALILQWDETRLVAWPASSAATVPPAGPPSSGGSGRALAPTSTTVDAVLAVLLQLGQDRPDNAQLTARNGARWLRSATLEGRTVDVIEGPHARQGGSAGAVTYWIDRTGRMLRVDVRLGGGTQTTRISLDAGAFRRFARSAQLPG